mgnify:CR=1 FL=1
MIEVKKEDYYLYFRSKAPYEDLESNLDKFMKTGNDIYLDYSCFHAQQCIELLLKGILQYFDIEFPTSGGQGHNIKSLLNLINENTPINFYSKNRLFSLADTISKWETQGRYGEGVKTKVDTVRNIKNIYDEIDESFLQFRYSQENKY